MLLGALFVVAIAPQGAGVGIPATDLPAPAAVVVDPERSPAHAPAEAAAMGAPDPEESIEPFSNFSLDGLYVVEEPQP